MKRLLFVAGLEGLCLFAPQSQSPDIGEAEGIVFIAAAIRKHSKVLQLLVVVLSLLFAVILMITTRLFRASKGLGYSKPPVGP